MKKILKDYNKFVCVPAGKINYLIPSSQVDAALYCNEDCCFLNGKFCYKNRVIPYINFYSETNQDDDEIDTLYTELVLVIKNTTLYENTNDFALVIPDECSVITLRYKDFSLFSDRLNKQLKKVGYVANYFKDGKVYYLLDIEKYMKNFIN